MAYFCPQHPGPVKLRTVQGLHQERRCPQGHPPTGRAEQCLLPGPPLLTLHSTWDELEGMSDKRGGWVQRSPGL